MRGFRGVSRSLNAIAREQRRMQTAALALQRTQARQAQMAAKMALQDHLAARATEADELTDSVRRQVEELEHILSSAASKEFALTFGSLKIRAKRIPFDAGGLDVAKPAPNEADFQPEQPNFLLRMIPAIAQKYAQAL